jgi:hypothetical protein
LSYRNASNDPHLKSWFLKGKAERERRADYDL